MTAREQAREAAWNAQAHLAMDDADINGAADAASDVWEPHLADAVDLIEHYIDLLGEPTEAEWAVYYRLRKALR